eukprot:6489176-Prymnesium_polylepis.1
MKDSADQTADRSHTRLRGVSRCLTIALSLALSRALVASRRSVSTLPRAEGEAARCTRALHT